MEPKKPKNVTDHLANERTFLAWIRTAIAVLGFGFVVVKFSLFLEYFAAVSGKNIEVPTSEYSSELGLSFVIIGVLVVLFAYIRYKRNEQKIDGTEFRNNSLLVTVLTVLMVLISILLFWYLYTNIRAYQ